MFLPSLLHTVITNQMRRRRLSGLVDLQTATKAVKQDAISNSSTPVSSSGLVIAQIRHYIPIKPTTLLSVSTLLQTVKQTEKANAVKLCWRHSRPVGGKWNGCGVLFVKKRILPPQNETKQSNFAFLFYILLIGGVRMHPLPTGMHSCYIRLAIEWVSEKRFNVPLDNL